MARQRKQKTPLQSIVQAAQASQSSETTEAPTKAPAPTGDPLTKLAAYELGKGGDDQVSLTIKVPRRLRDYWVGKAKLEGGSLKDYVVKGLAGLLGWPD